MCAGMAVLFGPPSVGASCYYVFTMGKTRMLRHRREARSYAPFRAGLLSLGSGVGAYVLQKVMLVRHFDEGGALSLNWKKGVDSLGEPLKSNACLALAVPKAR